LPAPKAGAFVNLEQGVGFQEAAKSLGFFVGKIDEGQSDLIAAVALESDGRFDGDGIGVEPHKTGEKWVVTLLDLQSFGKFPFEAAADEARHHFWDEIGSNAHEAHSTT
jgi:hypothetical protein